MATTFGKIVEGKKILRLLGSQGSKISILMMMMMMMMKSHPSQTS
jgi:hypothetical protein